MFKDEIIKLLQDINPYEEIKEDTDLLENEVLDSISIMILIEEMETKFNIKVNLETIEIEDFRDIKSLENLIMKSKEQ